MKGLLRYLSPFAPDQSGAVGVLYELGGLIVILDAGGCSGNICGFDEPRWFIRKSAIFSAGLRDMDAILGRDEQLVKKVVQAVEQIHPSFIALIGTPVPAVIATDYKALVKMLEKRCDIPAIYVEGTGTRLYDQGEEEAWLALFQKFTTKTEQRNAIGILGVTPLSASVTKFPEHLITHYQAAGYHEVICYGMGCGLSSIIEASCVQKNIVVSPAGIKAAKYLEKTYGIPYEVSYPFFPDSFLTQLNQVKAKSVLVVHQQAAGNEIRNAMNQAQKVTVATWFMQQSELLASGDIKLETEDQFCELINKGGYDVIVGDPYLKSALKNSSVRFIGTPHFAISGELMDE